MKSKKREFKKREFNSFTPYEDKGRDINTEVREKTTAQVYKGTGDVVRMGKRTFTKGLDFGRPRKVKKSFNSGGMRF
jgi:hypothetical protein